MMPMQVLDFLVSLLVRLPKLTSVAFVHLALPAHFDDILGHLIQLQIWLPKAA
jgi:hypothetical protein